VANDEYLTPLEYIKSARNVMGTIDLDPASSEIGNSRVKANHFFSIKNPALEGIDWEGNVWLNPPYSRGNLPYFTKLLLHNWKFLMQQAIYLVPNSTSEKWYQKILKTEKSLACLTDHRIEFILFENGRFYHQTNPEFGNTFFYLGNEPDRFVDEFSKWGTITKSI